MGKGPLKLENTIRAWESILLYNRFLMASSIVVIVESTITHLIELKAIRAKSKKVAEDEAL